MKSSKQSRHEAKDLYRSCMVNGRLDESRVHKAVNAVLEIKPRGYFDILAFFKRLVKLDVHRHTAVVESALPLDGIAQSNVESTLRRLHGDGLTIQYAPNAALIGGVKIQVGSSVYDGSVRGRLDELNDKF